MKACTACFSVGVESYLVTRASVGSVDARCNECMKEEDMCLWLWFRLLFILFYTSKFFLLPEHVTLHLHVTWMPCIAAITPARSLARVHQFAAANRFTSDCNATFGNVRPCSRNARMVPPGK